MKNNFTNNISYLKKNVEYELLRKSDKYRNIYWSLRKQNAIWQTRNTLKYYYYVFISKKHLNKWKEYNYERNSDLND